LSVFFVEIRLIIYRKKMLTLFYHLKTAFRTFRLLISVKVINKHRQVINLFSVNERSAKLGIFVV
jgi:hypothetical protein